MTSPFFVGPLAALAVAFVLVVAPRDAEWSVLLVPALLVSVPALRGKSLAWGVPAAALIGGSIPAAFAAGSASEDSPAGIVAIGTALVFVVFALVPLCVSWVLFLFPRSRRL